MTEKLPNGPQLWITGEAENAHRRVLDARKKVAELSDAYHASTEQVEWILKTQAMHTAWALAQGVMDGLIRDGYEDKAAWSRTLKAIERAAMTQRIEQSTSAVGNYQSILLVEAYRRVASDLTSMRDGL